MVVRQIIFFVFLSSVTFFLVTCGDASSSSGNTSGDDATADTIESVTLAAYDDIAEKLAEIKDLAEQAALDSETDANRSTYQTEVDTLITEINDLTDSTTFNGRKVLFGSAPTTLSTEGTYEALPQQIPQLLDAVNALSEGNQTVEITYSFVIAGTSVVDLGTTYTAVELKDQQDGSVTHDEFKQEISEALALWEDLFERVFNPANGSGGILDVKFVNLVDETGTSQPVSSSSGTYAVPGSENLGMFRYAMAGHMSTAAPFSPTGKTSDGIDDHSGEISFGSGNNWRQDRESETGSSVKIVAAHEMGHGFGFGHDQSSTNNMMNPANITQGSIRELFPDGLFFKEGSSELAGIVYMYGENVTLTDPDPYTLTDGTTADFPTVNAATLGVNAVKVRSQDEAEEAIILIEEAETQLAEWRATIEAL